jgi:sec-independent protein translocase protein TatB
MQMLGIGVPELLLILFLSVLVVGPDRLPGFAADLARWIRRTRAYANHLMRDFNDVMGDLEKEAGASRADWKEIADVVGLHTGSVGRELQKVASQLEQAGDLSDVKLEEPSATAAGTANGAAANGAHATTSPEPAEPVAEAPAAEEKPWFVPERRRHLRDD